MNRINQIFLLIACLSFTVFIYSFGLPGGFEHDDFPNIVNNDKLHITDLKLESLLAASTSTKSGPLSRPISLFSFAINYYFYQLQPFSYKVINLIIHIISGISLFILSYLLLDSYKKISNEKLSSKVCFYIALLTMAAWLLSPINLTAVLYVVQRMTSLSALFSILGLCCYTQARRSMILSKENSYYFYFIASAISFFVALFCKEIAALNIFYVICIEICFFRFFSKVWITPQAFRLIFLLCTLTPITLILLWFASNPSFISAGYAFNEFNLTERMLTEARMLTSYLKWTFIPNIVELGLYHDDIKISTSLFNPVSTIISITAVGVLFLTAVALVKKLPFLSFGILFFFSSHILESTVLPLEIAYEHRNYLASFGIIFGVITSIFLFIRNDSNIKLAILIVCLWISALSLTTGIRAKQWENSIVLAYYEASHHPQSARAIFNLGKVYANLSIQDILDDKERAIKLFENFMVLAPNSIIGESSAIVLNSIAGYSPKPVWVNNIIKKLETYPITHSTNESLKSINDCLANSCQLTTQQVFNLYIAGLNNEIPTAKEYRSDFLTLYASFAANHLGDFNLAKNTMLEAIELSPDVLQYRINLITILIHTEQYTEALFNIDYVKNNDTYHAFRKTINELENKLVDKNI